MKNDIDKTIAKIEDDLQENADADWIPGAAPTQHYQNRLSLMLAPDDAPESAWHPTPRVPLSLISRPSEPSAVIDSPEVYFEAECQDCGWQIQRQQISDNHFDWIRQACFHAHNNGHDVEYTHSIQDLSVNHVIAGKPKGFWEQCINVLSLNNKKLIAAICLGIVINFTIDYFWDIERGLESMTITFFSSGLCYLGICGIVALWRKLKTTFKR